MEEISNASVANVLSVVETKNKAVAKVPSKVLLAQSLFYIMITVI
jgi:hypothetical protein